jgi:TrmH family RNA methyltransferase
VTPFATRRSPSAASDRLDQYRLVLVRTQFGGNLGACARAASNFDLRDIFVVNSFTSIHDSEAKKYATNAAREFLESSKTTIRLDQALIGVHAAVAFTNRTGVVRNPTIEVSDIPRLAARGRVALVFGNEQDGLSGEEVSRCTHICKIHTADVHPSLNLSHAVAIVLARLFDESAHQENVRSPIANTDEEGSPFSSRPAPIEEFHNLLNLWARVLKDLEYGPKDFPDRVLAQISRTLGRGRLEQAEVTVLKEFLARIELALATKRDS